MKKKKNKKEEASITEREVLNVRIILSEEQTVLYHEKGFMALCEDIKSQIEEKTDMQIATRGLNNWQKKGKKKEEPAIGF